LEELLERLDDDDIDGRVRALCWLSFITVFSGDIDRSRRLRDDVVPLARAASADLSGLIFALLILFQPSTRTRATILDSLARLRDWIDQDDAGDAEQRGRDLSQAFYGSLVLGDGDEVRRCHSEMGDLLVGFPHPLLEDAHALHSIMLAAAAGEPHELEQHVVEFATAATRHGRPDEASLYATVGSIGLAWERDGMGVLVDIAVAMTQADNPTPAAWSVAASALSHAGRTAEAVAMIDEQFARGMPDIVDDASWPVAVAYWIDAAVSTRRLALSRDLYERLLPLAGTHLVTGGFYGGSVALHLGRLASVLELPDATAWFKQALDEHVVLDGPAWIARTHLNWAEHLAAVGNRESAHHHAQLALDTIADRDFRVTAQRARALLSS
jgi:tetratricopeptide (TPR) repeat protein